MGVGTQLPVITLTAYISTYNVKVTVTISSRQLLAISCLSTHFVITVQGTNKRCWHTRARAHTKAGTHTYTRTRTHAYTGMYTLMQAHTCMQAGTHAGTRTHTQIHTHVRTQTQTHTQNLYKSYSVDLYIQKLIQVVFG